MIKLKRLPPRLAYKILITYRSYLVGSSINYVLGSSNVVPKDFDIAVDPDDYQLACRLVATANEGAWLNSFGGLKFNDRFGVYDDARPLVDIWPSTLDTYIRKNVDHKALSLNPNKLVKWL